MDETEMHCSLFGQKLIIPKLNDRSRPRTQTGITSLPTEILLWIFHLLSSGGRRSPFPLKHYTSHIKNPHLCNCDHAWAPEIFPSRCTLFPYAQSGVCRHWRGVLALQPTFWTRVIVSRRPGQHTPPQLLEKYLQWSRDLQIEVYVGNIRDEGRYPSERPLIKTYNRILQPHVWRCKVIDYEVEYSTSLPCLLRELRDLPPFLETLRLKSERIADAQAPPLENECDIREFHSAGEHVAQSFQSFTSLNHLVLNGRNFLLAYAYLPELLTNAGSILIENYRKTLHLHPEIESIPFQFLDMLSILASNPRTHDLKFNNLEFQNMEDIRIELSRGPTEFPFGFQFDVLELTKIHQLMLQQFVAYIEPGGITLVIFDSIDLAGFDLNFAVRFRRVELRNISGDNIRLFLRQWRGGSLSLRDCPCLTDDILHEIGYTKARRAVSLRDFEIHNCHNFSVEGLKDMMAVRHNLFLQVFDGQFQSASVASQAEIVPALTVRGARQHISDKDRRWFNELTSLCRFEWQMCPLALQEADVELDIEMEDDTELELDDVTAGDVYSNMEEELDAERYTAPELVIDWPLVEFKLGKSPPIVPSLPEIPDSILGPPDAELALWADFIFNTENVLSDAQRRVT